MNTTTKPNIADVLMNGINADGTVTPVVDFVEVTDDEILAALFGTVVTIAGPKYNHVLTFGPDKYTKGDRFHVDFAIDDRGPKGIISCDEANLRLLRFV